MCMKVAVQARITVLKNNKTTNPWKAEELIKKIRIASDLDSSKECLLSFVYFFPQNN